MLQLIFVAWLPLVLIIASPIINLIFSLRRLKNKSTIPLWKSTITIFFLGLILPVLATVLSMYFATTFDPDIKCLTGYVGFAPLGWLLTIVVIPTTFFIFYLILQPKKNMPISQVE